MGGGHQELPARHGRLEAGYDGDVVLVQEASLANIVLHLLGELQAKLLPVVEDGAAVLFVASATLGYDLVTRLL